MHYAAIHQTIIDRFCNGLNDRFFMFTYFLLDECKSWGNLPVAHLLIQLIIIHVSKATQNPHRCFT